MSLLDMLRINAKPFVKVMYTLGHARSSLLNSMREEAAGGPRAMFRGGAIGDDSLGLQDLVEELQSLGLSLSVISAERLLLLLQSGDVHAAQVTDAIRELSGRVQDELGGSYLVSLTSSEKDNVEPIVFPFGDSVAQQFPSLVPEVLNGHKCLGFGLPTAAAFHFIRCLEAGITAMSRSLSIPDPTKGSDRSWMKALGKIKTAIDAKWPPGPIRTGHAQFFEEAYAVLAAIQNPYRNATMHLDHRYDADEANSIKAMVESFMRKLASQMDEDGLPLA